VEPPSDPPVVDAGADGEFLRRRGSHVPRRPVRGAAGSGVKYLENAVGIIIGIVDAIIIIIIVIIVIIIIIIIVIIIIVIFVVINDIIVIVIVIFGGGTGQIGSQTGAPAATRQA
jgi:hypothetical protein